MKKIKFNWNHLITEDGENISIGRLSFWIVFVILLGYWIYDIVMISRCQQIIDAPDSLLYAFFSLMMYNTGKKITNAIVNRNKYLNSDDLIEDDKED